MSRRRLPREERPGSAPERFRVGVFTTTPHDPSDGPAVVEDIVACIHCGFCWPYRPGSGRIIGYCARCDGLLCGRAYCVARGCVCWRQGIDNMEAGRPENFRPVAVSVPTAPPVSHAGGIILGRG